MVSSVERCSTANAGFSPGLVCALTTPDIINRKAADISLEHINSDDLAIRCKTFMVFTLFWNTLSSKGVNF